MIKMPASLRLNQLSWGAARAPKPLPLKTRLVPLLSVSCCDAEFQPLDSVFVCSLDIFFPESQ